MMFWVGGKKCIPKNEKCIVFPKQSIQSIWTCWCNRPYLMTLYVIFPIHLNFLIRSESVFKTIIPRKKSVDCLSVVICVCCMSCPEIFFPKMAFSSILWVVPNKISFCQPWWRPLVNTCQISQFPENIISFNFLANALYRVMRLKKS